MRINKLTTALAIVGLASISGAALATDGYFAHGYGIKAKGMGGAATAMAEDAMGGANNPASMVWVGNRLDVGIDWFRPIREAKRVGSTNGANDFSQKSDTNNFFIPEFGYNKMLTKSMSFGVTVYGNGGMNTDYNGNTTNQFNCTGGMSGVMGAPNTLNALCGSGQLGINLEQLIIAPTLAIKFDDKNSFGVSPLIGYQRFKANGLDGFSGLSTDSAHLTNQGADDAFGIGVRLGWQGHYDQITLGASISSKVYMQEFDKYKGLFAEQGSFDIPANLSLGVAWKANPNLTLAMDYQYIDYEGVDAVSNSGTTLGCTNGSASNPSNPICLGGNNGLGFGWKSINVWKLGAEYKASSALTLRAGYNHTDNPIKSDQVTFNILAPGVVQDHVTLGMTYAVSPGSEVSFAYMHAFEKSVSGPTNANFPVGGTETIKMYQDSFGASYSMKF